MTWLGSSSAILAHVSESGCWPSGTLPRAALEVEQPGEVLGQDELLEVAPDEDHDWVVAELTLEVLGRREALRIAVDEGVRARIGLEAQRTATPSRHRNIVPTTTGTGRRTAQAASLTRSSLMRTG